jgi:hypothetical protein
MRHVLPTCARSRINVPPLLDCSTYIFENQLSEIVHARDAGSRVMKWAAQGNPQSRYGRLERRDRRVAS